jgi:two-component system chemotaxis response regulator CheY
MAKTKKTVLIVEDSTFVYTLLKEILEKSDFNVIGHAKDGMEGIKKFKELSPDITTMDVTMPKMDGVQALRIIKSLNNDAKVVMVTSINRLDKIVECRNVGASQYITKPFEEERVLKVFANL